MLLNFENAIYKDKSMLLTMHEKKNPETDNHKYSAQLTTDTWRILEMETDIMGQTSQIVDNTFRVDNTSRVRHPESDNLDKYTLSRHQETDTQTKELGENLSSTLKRTSKMQHFHCNCFQHVQ